MADVNLSPYTAEQQAMDRRRKMAEAMQQQAVAPIEMPTVPGAKVSHLQGLAKLLQGYIAGKNLSKADQEQKDYENQVSGETAHLFSNMGQYETVPGKVITPGKAAIYEEPAPIQENIDRRQELRDLAFPKPENEARAAIAYNLMRPEDKERIKNAPSMTEPKEISAAVSEVRSPSQQIPVLNASYLDPTKPNAYKTGQVRSMLAQYLMQQEAQKQAAAQAEAAAARQIHAFNPEQNVGRIVNDKYVPLIEGQLKPMTESQRLDAEAKIYAARVEAEKAKDQGRPSLNFEPAPKGVPIGAKRTGGKTPQGKDVWTLNGEMFVGE